jgi:hypothetical protein
MLRGKWNSIQWLYNGTRLIKTESFSNYVDANIFSEVTKTSNKYQVTRVAEYL